MASAKHLVLITPGQPATNPRLVKEVEAFVQTGYRVSVLYNFWAAWGDPIDAQLKAAYPQVNWIRVGGHPTEAKWRFWFTRIRHKWLRKRINVVSANAQTLAKLEARAFPELWQAAKRLPADLYIAHNLGALPVAALAARKNGAKYAFDAEDFHRGQVLESSVDYRRIVALEDAYLPGADACWAASPMIAERYAALYPGLNPLSILNVFSLRYKVEPRSTIHTSSASLRLFWFSQTVGRGRGVEEVITAMGKVANPAITLTIVGACSDSMLMNLQQVMDSAGVANEQVTFHAPLPLDRLFELAAQHQVGLAFETEATENRRICLTNKIFTYILAGLPVLANNTPAQLRFLNEHPTIGKIVDLQHTASLTTLLQQWVDEPETLLMMKEQVKLASQYLNWEREQQSLLALVEQTLTK